MITYANISDFMDWFISNVITINQWIWRELSNITISNSGVTLLQFIAGIIIGSAFITIIMNSAINSGNKITNAIERKKK